MRYRYLVGLVSILFVLTNCSSSNKQDPMLNVISTLRTVVKERNNPTPIVDPTKVIMREMLDASSQPLILIQVPTRQIIATLGCSLEKHWGLSGWEQMVAASLRTMEFYGRRGG